MIQIDRIRMRLPPGYQHRAATIARMVGDQLARQSFPRDLSLEAVAITPQRINPNTPDDEIAKLIVDKIVFQNGGAT